MRRHARDGTALALCNIQMPNVTRAKDRRHDVRPGLKVKHRHRFGRAVVDRTSELVFIKGRPVAVLEWISLGDIRTPLLMCELDPAKLRPSDERSLFHYEDVTADPRSADAR